MRDAAIVFLISGFRVEELEAMDMVKAVAKGGKIPASITEEDRERLEKTIREQEVLLQVV